MRTAWQKRICLVLGALFFVGSAFLPWWNLKLVAPQYQEGLNITVYPSKLVGEIDIINILNHYIGMAHISAEGFPELQYIPYILFGIAGLILLNAVMLSSKMSYGIVSVIVVGGIVGMYDMYHWLTVFGTDLDPMAPIKVPPFIPPVIGQNQLANFTTYSQFQSGFYLVVLGGMCVFLAVWGDKLRSKKTV